LAQLFFAGALAADIPDELTNLIRYFNQMGISLEQKRKELLQSKKMASIGTFISGMAHEINNSLNNISLSTDILIEDFDSIDKEEIKEILRDIMNQTERASKIVRNLLDSSKSHSSDMEALSIAKVLDKTAELIANELQIHKISLKRNIIDPLPIVHGDLQMLQQAFLNLIINAEQAIGDCGVIAIGASSTDKGYVRVDICDSGPGIEQEYLDQIFDQIFTIKKIGLGTSLGLAIVYDIIEKHGGYIEVSSTVSEGSTFSVYLPVYQ
jgi:two-component system, NtrC family, sensor kinase